MIGWLCRAVLIAGVCFGFPALATDNAACGNPQTQMDMNQCAGQAFVAADADLNRAYQAALKVTKAWDADMGTRDLKGAASALLSAQRAWIAYRDGHCTVVGFGARGGSMEPMLVAMCKTDLTKARAKQLTDLVTIRE